MPHIPFSQLGGPQDISEHSHLQFSGIRAFFFFFFFFCKWRMTSPQIRAASGPQRSSSERAVGDVGILIFLSPCHISHVPPSYPLGKEELSNHSWSLPCPLPFQFFHLQTSTESGKHSEEQDTKKFLKTPPFIGSQGVPFKKPGPPLSHSSNGFPSCPSLYL